MYDYRGKVYFKIRNIFRICEGERNFLMGVGNYFMELMLIFY